MSRSFARGLHSSARAASHTGSAPIPIPPNVTLQLPISSISPTLPPSSPLAQRSVHVKGPLGSHTVPIAVPIILESDTKHLRVNVHDVEAKQHRSAWGLTRTLINNAVVGVSEGYTVDIRLVGVGYRAAVEPIPEVFRNLQSQLTAAKRSSSGPTGDSRSSTELPTDRLNLKLGYAHPIYIDIPHCITVTIPAPTQILLRGTDKQQLGLFAAQIRRWRKPEPYRGKVCRG